MELALKCGEDIEEFEIDSLVPPAGKESFEVVILTDETIIEAKPLGCESDPRVSVDGYYYERTESMEECQYLVVTCWAVNKEHAIKIASEKLAEHLYNNPDRVPAKGVSE